MKSRTLAVHRQFRKDRAQKAVVSSARAPVHRAFIKVSTEGRRVSATCKMCETSRAHASLDVSRSCCPTNRPIDITRRHSRATATSLIVHGWAHEDGVGRGDLSELLTADCTALDGKPSPLGVRPPTPALHEMRLVDCVRSCSPALTGPASCMRRAYSRLVCRRRCRIRRNGLSPFEHPHKRRRTSRAPWDKAASSFQKAYPSRRAA